MFTIQYLKATTDRYIPLYLDDLNHTQYGGISFNTYFNSFYTNHWIEHTTVRHFSYSLILTGNICVQLYQVGHKHKEILLKEEILNSCNSSSTQKIDFTISTKDKGTRLYLKILYLDPLSKFITGQLQTEADYLSTNIKIGIVTCSFKRDDYLKKTIKEIYSREDIIHDIITYIIDNGQTLLEKDFSHYNNLKLISNKNLGGAGGFTRGIIEAKNNSQVSHILLMDDDISLDAETIFRTIQFLKYVNTNIAIAGTMLNKYRYNFQFESGANYHPYFIGYQPKFTNLNMEKKENIDLMTQSNSFTYGGWWYFLFSKEQLLKAGYPLPFFLLGDDSEYGLRLQKLAKANIIAPPGIAIWHDPFSAKKQNWIKYYFVRNLVIVNLIHFPFSIYYKIFSLAESLLAGIFKFNYEQTYYTIQALKDLLKGPSFFENLDHEKNHLELIKKQKVNIVSNYLKIEKQYRILSPKKNIILTALSYITLNGHLLPKSLLKNKEVLIKNYIRCPHTVVGNKYIRELIPFTKQYQVREISHRIFFKNLFEFIILFGILFIKIPVLKKKWNLKKEILTSEQYWNKQF